MEDTDKIWAAIISAIMGVGVYFSAIADFLIAGPIIGVVAGFTLSYLVQTKTQKRAWKREFLLKNIEQIYGPIYNESLELEKQYMIMIDEHYYHRFQTQEWEKIRNTYTYHMIEDRDFQKELDNFHFEIDAYNKICDYSREKVTEVLKKESSKFYNVKVQEITFFQKQKNFMPTVKVSNCLLYNIHPKDTFNDPTSKTKIQIEHRIENTLHQIELEEPEDMEKFEQLWNKMNQEISEDKDIENTRTMALNLHKKNLAIREKLVKRISERQKL